MVSSHHFINISSCKNNDNDNNNDNNNHNNDNDNTTNTNSIDTFPNFSMNTSDTVHAYDEGIHTKILHVNLQFIVFSNIKYVFLDMGYGGVK